jgi:hypothetical protein
MEGVRKTTEILIHGDQCPGRDSKYASHKYKSQYVGSQESNW